jgi:hypothetical protein
MQRAVETAGEPGTLTSVTFGRFADLDAGWYWTLSVTREITSEHPHLAPSEDGLGRRIKLVVTEWRTAVRRYEERDGAPQPQG